MYLRDLTSLRMPASPHSRRIRLSRQFEMTAKRIGPVRTGHLGPLTNATSTEFLGRIALVTGGAGAAIGSATCKMLAARGAAVVVLDENERRTHAMVQSLTEEFGHAGLTDGGRRRRPRSHRRRSRSSRGRARTDRHSGQQRRHQRPGQHLRLRPEDWDRVINVDLTASWYLMRMLVADMRDRGWGSIVNVTSVAAYLGGNGREGPYGAAKAGLHDLTRAVAIEGGPYGIRCNAVAPGLDSIEVGRRSSRTLRGIHRRDAAPPARRARGRGQYHRFPRLRGVRPHHRPDHQCQRRLVPHPVTTGEEVTPA